METLPTLLEARVAIADGNLTRAEALCRRAIREGEVRDGGLVLAETLIRQGRATDAESILMTLISKHPDFGMGYSLLSCILFRTGRVDDGVRHGKSATEFAPQAPTVWADFCGELLIAHKNAEALRVAAQAVDTNLDEWLFALLFAQRLTMSYQRDDWSVFALEAACKRHPNGFGPRFALSGMLSVNGRLTDALIHANRAVEIRPDSIDAWRMLAHLRTDSRDFAGAAAANERVVQLNGNDAKALFSLGAYRQRLGNFTGAQDLLSRAVEAEPTFGEAHYALLRGRTESDDLQLLQRLTNLAKKEETSELNRSYFYFAIGNVQEDRGQFELAISAYDEAREWGRRHWVGQHPWTADRDLAFYRSLAQALSSDTIAGLQRHGNPSEQPLLVVGMPRSGTSLVEQILTSHPDIGGAGEMSFWSEPAHQIFRPGTGTEESTLRRSAREYLARLQCVGGNLPRITDKVPQNFLVMGLVAAALPNARFIHVRRNAVDTCLSIYTTPFGVPPAFTHTRSDIVSAYRAYLDIMQTWREAIPSHQLLEVDYEDLVRDREIWTRRLIEFSGLEWNEACLRHETNSRPVETASIWQVRQPLYSTSVGRSERFRPWLGEFLELETPLPHRSTWPDEPKDGPHS